MALAQDVLDLLTAWGWERGLEKAWERLTPGPGGPPQEALGRLDSLPGVKHPAGRCRLGA